MFSKKEVVCPLCREAESKDMEIKLVDGRDKILALVTV